VGGRSEIGARESRSCAGIGTALTVGRAGGVYRICEFLRHAHKGKRQISAEIRSY
jgi:hypothetical protein